MLYDQLKLQRYINNHRYNTLLSYIKSFLTLLHTCTCYILIYSIYNIIYIFFTLNDCYKQEIIDKDKSAFDKYMSKSSARELHQTVAQIESKVDDGMADIDNALLKLRFPNDLRVAEARRLLQSSQPVTISITQRPDVSDHDFIEEQEKHLFAMCTRTMALPVGRGMFTLCTASPVPTETLIIPPLCLIGKAPPRGTTVELSHIDISPSMNNWPLFHNGVANGLRINPNSPNIDSSWITFNKPKGNNEIEHAGFLMALGLNGFLQNLSVYRVYEYLNKEQEMTNIGILIGRISLFHRIAS